MNVVFKNPKYYIYGFFICIIAATFLNYTILQHHGVYLVFTLAAVCLGLGFYQRSIWLLLVFTLIVMIFRETLVDKPIHLKFDFILDYINYMLIVLISAGLMKNYQKVKNDNLELTKSLANALDSRDTYTLHHSENVAKYGLAIAKKMKLSQALCDTIYLGGLLHDIGKIGIPEHILIKPGKLTSEEYNIIKSHPLIGYEMIKHVSHFNEIGVLDIVLYHHERYDGKGYPKGLKENEIPLVAQIIGIADAFDAMTSKRVYKQKFLVADALNEIRKNSGKQFNPEIVQFFLSLFESPIKETIPSEIKKLEVPR